MIKKYFVLICLAFGLFFQSYSQTLSLPPRNLTARNGTQIVSLLTPLSLTAREDTIYQQVIAGNVPDFMRQMIVVKDTETVSSQQYIIEYYVIPDYLALGCDSDYFLCPMTPLLAQRLANYLGCSLPTRKMVNQIWKQASLKLAPQTIPPSGLMTTVPVFDDHNDMVWTSRSAQLLSHPLGELVGGDKKDVVISNIIYGYPSPGRVVIYGWHQLNGSPIQPLYNGHEETYADYSHGIRFVQNEVMVNGSVTSIQTILASSTLNVLLSDEGVIAIPNYPVTAPTLTRPESFCVLDSAEGIIHVKVLPNADVKGYNVLMSRDGLVFDMPVFYSGHSFNIEGLSADTLYYLKISAEGYFGNTSPYSEVLAATTYGSAFAENPWMIINAFDRATTGNTYDFIRQHASAIFGGNVQSAISSATNEAMCDSLILLSDFMAVNYILGEESSVNETFSDEEQQIIAAYNGPHKPIFVSGSEIGWDLDHLGSVSDKAFFNNVLHAAYVEDAPNNLASSYYQFTTATSTYEFDDGTNGTYDVRYPDVVELSTLPSVDLNNLGYYTGFPSKYVGVWEKYSMVYLAVPFETIYPESARSDFMDWVNEIFFLMDDASVLIPDEIKIFPNPVRDILHVSFSVTNTQPADLCLMDISGKMISGYDRQIEPGETLDIFMKELPKGVYVLNIKTNKTTLSKKIVLL